MLRVRKIASALLVFLLCSGFSSCQKDARSVWSELLAKCAVSDLVKG
jgi:hypothetical protein